MREQLFLRLHQELPYAITLRLASCLPQLDGSGAACTAWGKLRFAPLCLIRAAALALQVQCCRRAHPAVNPRALRPRSSSPFAPHTSTRAVKVEVDVVVPSQGAKAIVLGAGGAQVAAIGRAAAQGLEETWGHAVHLSLRVRVDKEGR